MFEKYPRPQCAVLETGANWISAWLDRMGHKVLGENAVRFYKLAGA